MRIHTLNQIDPPIVRLKTRTPLMLSMRPIHNTRNLIHKRLVQMIRRMLMMSLKTPIQIINIRRQHPDRTLRVNKHQRPHRIGRNQNRISIRSQHVTRNTQVLSTLQPTRRRQRLNHSIMHPTLTNRHLLTPKMPIITNMSRSNITTTKQ